MRIAIIGLGLMGGSLGLALKGFRGCIRVGATRNEAVLRQALDQGAIDEAAGSAEAAIAQADLTVFCTTPEHILQCLSQYAKLFRPGSVVTEIAGVKQAICERAAAVLPPEVQYAGVHPMAGKETSGFASADAAIFQGTGFLIAPIPATSGATITLLKDLAAHIGAKRIAVTDPREHDEVIAYSSDLMHAAAFGLCLDYPAGFTLAHAAGAFRDCTRIAASDAKLWTELFLDNADHLLPALERYIGGLTEMREALRHQDSRKLLEMLERANRNKKELQSR